ncbi:MAG: TRZ/ATZ family protein [Actinobacteria bacterium]|nr:MAG: TRZ/ATZ family protein [Actinomycetota bacterium]
MSIKVPVSSDICELKSGQQVEISGDLLVFRDQAHKRLVCELALNNKLPFDLENQAIFYAAPTETKPGGIIGSIGPTTSTRMDDFTKPLLEKGIKLLIGKGPRRKQVKDSLIKNKAIYLVTVGGAAAFLSKHIKKVKIIAYQDLGPEAVYLIKVEKFPAIVAIDCNGKDIFERS